MKDNVEIEISDNIEDVEYPQLCKVAESETVVLFVDKQSIIKLVDSKGNKCFEFVSGTVIKPFGSDCYVPFVGSLDIKIEQL